MDEHLLIVASANRRNQVEPDGPGSLASQAIKDQALQISTGPVVDAPKRRPDGRAQITPLCAQSIAGDDLPQSAQIESSLWLLSSGCPDFLRGWWLRGGPGAGGGS